MIQFPVSLNISGRLKGVSPALPDSNMTKGEGGHSAQHGPSALSFGTGEESLWRKRAKIYKQTFKMLRKGFSEFKVREFLMENFALTETQAEDVLREMLEE